MHRYPLLLSDCSLLAFCCGSVINHLGRFNSLLLKGDCISPARVDYKAGINPIKGDEPFPHHSPPSAGPRRSEVPSFCLPSPVPIHAVPLPTDPEVSFRARGKRTSALQPHTFLLQENSPQRPLVLCPVKVNFTCPPPGTKCGTNRINEQSTGTAPLRFGNEISGSSQGIIWFIC